MEILLIIGVLLQFVTFLITKSTILSLISGLAGVIAVVQCSKKKLNYYFFALIQVITYAVICYQTQLYGKLFEMSFYLIILIYGFFTWKNSICECELKTKQLSTKQRIYILFTWVSTVIVSVFILKHFGSIHPFLDSYTSITAMFAQTLLILRFRENWIFWILSNTVCAILWIITGNWCLVIQYLFCTINAICGFIKWKK